MPSLGGWEFVILIGVLVLLFGARKLPDMARSIGQSARVFKGEMKGMKADDQAAAEQIPQSAQVSTASPSTQLTTPIEAPLAVPVETNARRPADTP